MRTRGPSADQQMKDKGECYAWAQQQTGFDPMTAEAPPKTVSKQLEKQKVFGSGSTVRGAAGGALIGTMRRHRRRALHLLEPGGRPGDGPADRLGHGRRGRIRRVRRLHAAVGFAAP